MSTVIKRALCLLCFLALMGCTPYGRIYSDTTVPYSKVFRETPVGTKRCVLHDYQIKDPITGINLSAEWTAELIKSEADKAGIKDIYYVDQRTFSILFGIYKRKSLLIYGD